MNQYIKSTQQERDIEKQERGDVENFLKSDQV